MDICGDSKTFSSLVQDMSPEVSNKLEYARNRICKRGSGQKAIDVSSFFKPHDLHKEFAKFWRGSGNKSRAKFQKAWSKFEQELHQRVSK